jgi:hypothetical protein
MPQATCPPKVPPQRYTYRPVGIPMGDLTVLVFDADIPTAVGTEKHQKCSGL